MRALPANLDGTSQHFAREVCFCKKLHFMFVSPFLRSGLEHLHAASLLHRAARSRNATLARTFAVLLGYSFATLRLDVSCSN